MLTNIFDKYIYIYIYQILRMARNKCTTPIEVLRKIAQLECGTDITQSIFGPNNVKTFENLDWQFDQLYNGRQVLPSPCQRCPTFICGGRRVHVKTLHKRRKSNKRS